MNALDFDSNSNALILSCRLSLRPPVNHISPRFCKCFLCTGFACTKRERPDVACGYAQHFTSAHGVRELPLTKHYFSFSK